MIIIKGKVSQRAASDSSLAFIMPDVEVYAIDTNTGEKLFGPVYTDENGKYQIETNFEDSIAAKQARFSMVATAKGQGEEPCYGTVTRSNVLSTTPNQSGGQNISLVNNNGFNLLFEPDVCQSEVPDSEGDSVEEVVNQMQENTERTVQNTSMITKALILIAVGVVGYYAYKKYK